MTGFLIGAALAVAVTLLLLLRPFLWRGGPAATATHRQLNAAIYRDQFAELERDRSEGVLGEEDYQQARTELQRRVLEDGREEEPAAAPRAPRKTMLALGLLLPLAAAAIYFLIGNPAGINPPAPQQRFTAAEIEGMVARLAARLEKEPDNFQGWAMLARSYKAMGRLAEAEKAYGRAGKFVEEDAQLLADYADVAAANAGGNFEGKPAELIAKALKLDPDNLQALWLSGAAAFQRRQYAKAVADWMRLKNQLPPESDDARSLAESIAQARELGAAAPGKSKK